MKTRSFYSFAIALLLIAAAGSLAAQGFEGGVVTYQQTTKYDFETMFAPYMDNPKTKEWIASLPKEGKKAKVLYFTEEEALYEEDPTEDEALPRRLQGALARAEYFKPPKPELEKVFYDFRKNEMTRQVEFMTRDFLISAPIKKRAWKLTNKRVEILDYICLGAELKKGDDMITAMFTSEIPISAGPDEFFGLPGLILAIEINGETAFIATSIDLTPPKEGVLSRPDKGKKVIQEEFSKIVEEKVKEFNETAGDRGGNRGRRRR